MDDVLVRCSMLFTYCLAPVTVGGLVLADVSVCIFVTYQDCRKTITGFTLTLSE